MTISDYLRPSGYRSAVVGKTQLRWRLAMGLMALGTSIGALVYLLHPDPPFALVTAPIAIAVAFPVLATAIEVIFARWSKSTVSRKALGLAAIFFGLHMLDFPYLANQGGAAIPLGFTLGVLSIFGLSIFVPAVVQSQVAAPLDGTQLSGTWVPALNDLDFPAAAVSAVLGSGRA